MTDLAAAAPPSTTAARRFSESLHVLVDERTRSYIYGQAVAAAKLGKYDLPKEGEMIRALIDEAIDAAYARDPMLYEKTVAAGRRALAARRKMLAAKRAQQRAETGRMVKSARPVEA